MPEIVLFGATGYTGALTARAMVDRGLAPVLAGRNAATLQALAARLGGRFVVESPPGWPADAVEVVTQ